MMCELMGLISSKDVQSWLNTSPAWRNYLFDLINERLGDVITIVEEVAFGRVDRRIAGYLLARAEQTDSNLVKATHQEIASELGTSREVVSRILKDMEHQKCIEVRRGAIQLIDMPGGMPRGLVGHFVWILLFAKQVPLVPLLAMR